jgi:glycosyltransferase involved in cell wall biosynthesis
MVICPRVSVIIPAYNVRSYIEDALASLKCQSFQNFEAIVVDDGSSDGTELVVKSYAEKDSRFILLQKQNGGLSSARNYGIRHARGSYIALLDGDDVYHPDKLANHVGKLDTNSDVGVIYSVSRTIRDDGRPTFIYLSGKPVKSDPVLALLCKNFVCHGSNAMFRRCLVNEVGEFDENLRSSEDIDFWLRVALTRRWQFYREARALCYYRVRPSGLSFNVEQMQHSCQLVIQRAYSRYPELVEPILPTAYAYMYRYLARLCLQTGNIKQARDFLNQALAKDKSIFYTDLRSLITLMSVSLAPVAKLAVRQTLQIPVR